MTADLLPDLIFAAARRMPGRPALVYQGETLSYREVEAQVRAFASALVGLGLGPGDRVGVFLEKRFETVVGKFGAAAAGGAFVPINPLFKARQVGHILRDCNVKVLVTSPARLQGLGDALADCPDLQTLILADHRPGAAPPPEAAAAGQARLLAWEEALAEGGAVDRPGHRRIDADMTAIFYTSGSTGLPKGVVLSHRNMVAGARSVASYLENREDDRLLAALPLSFDAGFSQLTTAFGVGAAAVLLNYLMPRDVINAVVKERITGLTGVPPLYIQLTRTEWPAEATHTLRYFANTGGAMPRATLDKLRAALPKTKPYLMYGLTEAFRSTYLPPEEVDRRPDSMGKAIPNAEILVIGPDGGPVGPGESGELVHRGALVSLGYWNDPERTAERFKPAPGRPGEICVGETAVWSGDLVRIDAEGFLYFVGRNDEMIKTSGNRVSPSEIEEVLYASGLVGEAVAVGAAHPSLGQGVVVIAAPPDGGPLDGAAIMAECKSQLPAFMGPHHLVEKPALPRNPNGKIDRSLLHKEVAGVFMETAP
jgi:acyl-CoA ligase (AMP-forming) (exosortase A-associated)